MKYFGIDDQYFLAPKVVTTLPAWDVKYKRTLVYADDVDTMYYGAETQWVAVSANFAAGYIHTQSSPLATWSVTHNLAQKMVSITVYGSDDLMIMPVDILVVDGNNLTITFSEAISGKAVVVTGNPGTIPGGGINFSAGTSLSDHEFQGPNIKGVAGAAISRGQLCYCKLNGGAWKYYLYDADATDKLILPTALATADISQGNTGTFLLSGGSMRDDTWSLSGTADTATTVYASTTAGGLTMTAPSTSGNEVIVAGFLIAANVIQLSIGYTWVEVK